MARSALDERRLDVGARLESIGTACRELAAFRQIENVGHRAGNRRQALGARTVHTRQRSEQSPRVRVHRIAEDLLHRRELLNLPAVHHGHAIAHLGDDGEVVGNQEDRGVFLPRLHLEHQIQNLGLDGHVEGRRGLIRDQQVRRQRERYRNHDPLALAARKLVRDTASCARARRRSRRTAASRRCD